MFCVCVSIASTRPQPERAGSRVAGGESGCGWFCSWMHCQ